MGPYRIYVCLSSVCPHLLFPLGNTATATVVAATNGITRILHFKRRFIHPSLSLPATPWDELTIDRIDTVAAAAAKAAGSHVCSGWKRVFRPRLRRLYLPREIASVRSPLDLLVRHPPWSPRERLPSLSLFSITRLLRSGVVETVDKRGAIGDRQNFFPARSLHMFFFFQFMKIP